MTEDSPSEANRVDPLLGARWRHRTLIAFVISRLLTVLAAGLVFGGAVVYFEKFDFAKGGDVRGMWILFTGIGVAAIAIIGDLYSIYAALRTRSFTGSALWLVMTTLLPVIEIVIWAMIRKRM